jgi:hypothetical protein
MDEIISYKMCAVKVRNAKLRNYPTKMFRDAAVAEIVLVSPAHHRLFQYVIADQTVEISVHDRLESFVIVSKLII